MTKLLDTKEVRATFASPCWQHVVFNEFEATLTSKSRPFPCIYGVSGLKSGQLRFAFVDAITADTVGPLLRDYLGDARQIGKLTSLVVFCRPGPVQSIESYRNHFWTLLDDLERTDESPRPDGIPTELDDPHWEFCYGGEPIFVVCNSPAHVLRQSRRSTSFMVTFQPRWVFDGILDDESPAAQRGLETVRRHLEAFDAIETSPFLGRYGDPETREFQQYFLDDTNDKPTCPFHSLGAEDDRNTEKKGKVA
ncbi:MAG: YqcI/YcgG family protein [Pseudomonadota bacterium]